MLFTDVSKTDYELWSAKRCAIWLSGGIIAFLVLVYCSLSAITIRPSAELDLQALSNFQHTQQISASLLKEPQSLDAHGLNTAESIRCIGNDGSHREIPLKQFQPEKQHIRTAFLVCKERSVWTFLWQRLRHMLTGTA